MMRTTDNAGESHHGAGWLTWLLGLALLAAVVGAAVHFADQRAFVGLLQQAEPRWLAVAILLQAGTYLAQGGIWRRVADACGCPLPLRTAFELSLAKLFVDQALPSAGLSSSILIAKALEQRELPSPMVKASVLIDLTSYNLAYVIALAAALAIGVEHGQGTMPLVVTAAIFLALTVTLSAALLELAGRSHERLAAALRRFPAASRTLEFFAGADGRLVRSPRVLAATVALQASIFLLDAATVWLLILALGKRASLMGVFASFMIANLVRSVGIVPGGLGTFEAASVLTLGLVGVDLAVSLSATLLFRGLSFWLPMLPGYWFSRRALAEPRVRRRDPGPPRAAHSRPPRSSDAASPRPVICGVRQDQSDVHGR
jgi:Mg2+-importing ATPase